MTRRPPKRHWNRAASATIAVALTASACSVPAEDGSRAARPVIDFPDGYIQAVPPDFIEAIDAPRVVAADAVSWAGDTDVIGVVIDGDARAYPVSTLTAREMVLDDLGGVPVLVTWCPICATALVHERRIDGVTETFGVQGGLYRNAMTWYDHSTGSIWSQPFGEAIAGPLTGTTLELRSSSLTTWRVWRERHPDTTALDAPGSATGFDVANLVLVVTTEDATRGYPVRAASRQGVVNDDVGAIPIAVVVDPDDPNRWAVHRRDPDGTALDLSLVDGELIDEVTGRRWGALDGLAVHDGEDLTPVPAITVDPGFGPGRTPKLEILWPDASVWWPALAVG